MYTWLTRTNVYDYFVAELTLKESFYPQVYTVSESEDGQSRQRHVLCVCVCVHAYMQVRERERLSL